MATNDHVCLLAIGPGYCLRTPGGGGGGGGR